MNQDPETPKTESGLKSQLQKLQRIRSARNSRAGELQQMLTKCRKEVDELDEQIKAMKLEILRQPPLSLLHSRMLSKASQHTTPRPLHAAGAALLVQLGYLERTGDGFNAHEAIYRITEAGQARLRKDCPDGKVPGVAYTASSPWTAG